MDDKHKDEIVVSTNLCGETKKLCEFFFLFKEVQ